MSSVIIKFLLLLMYEIFDCLGTGIFNLNFDE